MELKTQSIVIMRGEVDPQTARMTGMKTLFVGVCSNGSVKHIQTNWFAFNCYDLFSRRGLLLNAFLNMVLPYSKTRVVFLFLFFLTATSSAAAFLMADCCKHTLKTVKITKRTP